MITPVDPGLLRGEQHVPLNERRGGLGVLNTAGALHQRRVHLHLRRGRESLLLQTAAQEREGALLPGRMFPTMVQIIAWALGITVEAAVWRRAALWSRSIEAPRQMAAVAVAVAAAAAAPARVTTWALLLLPMMMMATVTIPGAASHLIVLVTECSFSNYSGELCWAYKLYSIIDATFCFDETWSVIISTCSGEFS